MKELATEKLCNGCLLVKPTTEFHIHPRGTGYRYLCIKCWHIKHQPHYRKYVAKYPDKQAARIKLRKAISLGEIKRQPCEVCGEIKTHGHHEDYSKPFDVKWLCPKHHSEVHHKKL